ncbi:MAG: A/G-specific adenine glycosylase [Bacteroidetes bacterium HGW-Bacteroidetes-11]|jgi:A/G-specific adenine glycosylase|nr:MAG: A/G-specific adenine glycosylase [Bacteroidetes bacterium HGW-Bacteroidetes-11]
MDFNQRITEWYRINKRDLPWRKTRNPYFIWVSEIILQQTRIGQGLDYYLRFVDTFPDVSALAKASEQQVLEVWKGLGYYSRARNMHFTAQQVIEDFDGVFPSTFDTLISLKGIGQYTAAAIASICSGEPEPVVDGNVVRVFSRIFGFESPVGSTKIFKDVREKSKSFITDSDPGTYNQAVMEFGALFCKPKNPQCETCIFKDECYAFKNNRVEKLPLPKTDKPKRDRWMNYLVVVTPQGLLMQQRGIKDIWANLWEFPLLESDRLITVDEAIQWIDDERLLPDGTEIVKFEKDFQHILTHQRIFARFFIAWTKQEVVLQDSVHRRVIHKDFIQELPVSRLIDKFIDESSLND